MVTRADDSMMAFNEKDQLLADKTVQYNAPKQRSKSNEKEKTEFVRNFGRSPKGLGDMSSHAPESESILSMRHVDEAGKKVRTTDPVSSTFNMLNMYIGIAIIALPKAVSEVGFIGAIIGLIAVNLLSLGSSWFLLKARNRFKKQRIIDLPDLANACYGPVMKLLC